jgi:hypothetical protein
MTEQKPPLPCYCDHERRLFVQATRGPEGRSRVSLCPRCGQFKVFVDRGRTAITITFTLSTMEHIQAACRFIISIADDDIGDRINKWFIEEAENDRTDARN